MSYNSLNGFSHNSNLHFSLGAEKLKVQRF